MHNLLFIIYSIAHFGNFSRGILRDFPYTTKENSISNSNDFYSKKKKYFLKENQRKIFYPAYANSSKLISNNRSGRHDFLERRAKCSWKSKNKYIPPQNQIN
ncbi:hypothetical protein COU58_01300 [Candidatus Pacearchaeota archaeon CG10_big_fil_rev_8_21_14_0_10_32_42]|nr:MAG: hypothetical protein COU58_01300 [Candidatus Pacearchaeota archaeon CG10_big_fil_rev_8_21_14_0_10_32_42]